MRNNIILIGMPGVGKSTLGVLLAKALAKDFVDTDLLIQQGEADTLQSILDKHGYQALRAKEEEVLLSLSASNTVIATGGSAVHSDKGMQHLKQDGTAVYLEAAIDTLTARIENFDSRGIAAAPGTAFQDLYAERVPLYKRYADVTVNTDAGSAGEILQRLLALLDAEF